MLNSIVNYGKSHCNLRLMFKKAITMNKEGEACLFKKRKQANDNYNDNFNSFFNLCNNL